MKSKTYLTNLIFSEKTHDLVVFEGDLGKLVDLSLIDEVLVLLATNGTLRLSLTELQIQNALKRQEKSATSYAQHKRRKK